MCNGDQEMLWQDFPVTYRTPPAVKIHWRANAELSKRRRIDWKSPKDSMITVREADKVDKRKIETDKMEKWGKVGKSKWPQLH